MNINLGSGFDYRKGWCNVDYANIKCDVKHDVNVFPYPFKDNIADYILASAILEHLPIPNQSKLIMECYRILKENGILKIIVPHFTSVSAWENIEHVKGYSYETMNSFIDKGFTNSQKDYMQKNKFKDIKVKIVFGKKYQIWNYIIEPIANLFPAIYEGSFLRIFPAEGVHYELIK